MTRVARASFVVALAIVTCALLEAQERSAATPSGVVTVIGCVQRIDESGSLGKTIPERTPTPEQAGVAANRGEPGPGFMLTDAQDILRDRDFFPARANARSLPEGVALHFLDPAKGLDENAKWSKYFRDVFAGPR